MSLKVDIGTHPGCWERQVDAGWFVAINGGAEERVTTGGEGGAAYPPIPVPPFTVYVAWHGVPAGLLSPEGGTLAAGELANVDAFVAALKAAALPREE